LSILFALAASCGLCAESFSATVQKVPLPRPRPPLNTAKNTTKPAVPAAAQQNQAKHDANGSGLSSYAQANVGLRGALFDTRAHFKPMARPAAGPFAVAPTPSTSDADIAAVKRVIEAARKGREAEANAIQASISAPTTPIRRSSATPPGSKPIRAGRTPRCSAAAPRTHCGTTASTIAPCALSSPSSSR
jgi:hypothetical protein